MPPNFKLPSIENFSDIIIEMVREEKSRKVAESFLLSLASKPFEDTQLMEGIQQYIDVSAGTTVLADDEPIPIGYGSSTLYTVPWSIQKYKREYAFPQVTNAMKQYTQQMFQTDLSIVTTAQMDTVLGMWISDFIAEVRQKVNDLAALRLGKLVTDGIVPVYGRGLTGYDVTEYLWQDTIDEADIINSPTDVFQREANSFVAKHYRRPTICIIAQNVASIIRKSEEYKKIVYSATASKNMIPATREGQMIMETTGETPFWSGIAGMDVYVYSYPVVVQKQDGTAEDIESFADNSMVFMNPDGTLSVPYTSVALDNIITSTQYPLANIDTSKYGTGGGYWTSIANQVRINNFKQIKSVKVIPTTP